MGWFFGFRGSCHRSTPKIRKRRGPLPLALSINCRYRETEMKVYYKGRSLNHHMHVQPANQFPHVLEWREPDGRAKAFDIRFVNGVADVDDKLGEYLINQGLASKTMIIADLSEAG